MELGNRPKEANLLLSMGSVADAYVDSMAESFVSTVRRRVYPPPFLDHPSERESGYLRVHRVASTTLRGDNVLLTISTPLSTKYPPAVYRFGKTGTKCCHKP